MKIYFVTNYLTGYHKISGGAEQACHSLLELLNKKKQKAGILFTKPDLNSDEFDFEYIKTLEDSFPEKIKHFIRSMKILGVFYDPITLISSYNVLKKIKPNILNFQNFNILSFPLLIIAKYLKIPIIFSIYDFWALCPAGTLIDSKNEMCRKFNGIHCENCNFIPPSLNFLKKLKILRVILYFREKLFKIFLNKFDAFIVLSNSWARILEGYGIEKEKINVIPLPVEGKIKVKKQKIEKDSIVFVGWIHERKGLLMLVQAMSKILKKVPYAKLYVIGPSGDENYEKRIVDFIQKNKLEKKITFLGKKSHQETLDIVQKMEIGVVPEQWEIAWPIALTEFMISEKPTVSSNIGGMPDFIINGKNGFMVDHRNSDEFAEKIIWLLRNKKNAKRMGKIARKDALRICSEDLIFEKLMNLYKSLA
jgi:glycosyltransferase involved in cell wall biosynthesis